MYSHHPIVPCVAHRRALSLLAAMLASIAFIMMPTGSARAATYTVCASGCDYTTIQGAINAATDGDIVHVMDPVQYESNIQVNKNVTIQGNGAANTTVNGGGSGSVFTVSGSATFQRLTITGGSSYYGGGIATTHANAGTVQVINCTISDNVASFTGGGIYNYSDYASIDISHSTISDNVAGTYGGGIFSYGRNATFGISNSTISGNKASSQFGGGIFSYGPMTIGGSAVSDNTAGYSGGGVFIYGALTMTSSVISGNLTGGFINPNYPNQGPAHGYGGGITSYGILTIFNSTVSGNSAIDGTTANLSSSGGGVWSSGVQGGSLTISNSTIADNSAGTNGGIEGSYETFNVKSTISGNNTGGDCAFLQGSVNGIGNLDTDGSCGSGFVTVTPAALDLGPLAVNAPGSTATQALLQDSVAIDAASDCSDFGGTTIATDQRGVARPQGLTCDIGAYEYQPGVRHTHTVCHGRGCESPTIQRAIDNSNDGDTIEITLQIPLVLESGIHVDKNVTIRGQGASNTRVQGNGSDSVFHVAGSARIEKLTVSGGGTPLSGGAIDSEGGPNDTVHVTDAAITGNTATLDGGGISASGGAKVIVENTSISGNTAGRHGGGVSTQGTPMINQSALLVGGAIASETSPAATLQVTNAAITGNTAAVDGGGISASAGATVDISGTTVSGNTAGRHGGGISTQGVTVIDHSIISDNAATRHGGGISTQSQPFGIVLHDDASPTLGGGVFTNGALTLTGATISGNSADLGGGIMDNAPYTATSTITDSTISGNTAALSGGGIDNLGVLTIGNSTISNNSAIADGGGVFFDGRALGTLTISNTTVAGNSADTDGGGGIYANRAFDAKSTIIGNSPTGGDCAYYFETPNAVGNLDTDGSCGSGFTTVTPAELDLGPLTLNAPGATATQSLMSNSLAIDTAADCTDFNGVTVTTDQRGVARPQGAHCDIGAYEYVPVNYTQPRGHGYWKNHLDAVAPLLPVVLDDQYSVDTTHQATAVFRATKCKYATNCLAGELLTAILNVGSGSDPCIDPTISSAQDLLTTLGYSGPGGGVRHSKAQRHAALALHSMLGDYNSGMGCPR